ncbi:unnamed protein product [Pleuronectes platessa]|uniref:Uncharacterized protein n=1 Tax=Pleuronectes platessa TaxID=8262 RepID=A0A9N7VZU8_PLEPL|nr:unnamed protein product [Pleuronectes platessa]
MSIESPVFESKSESTNKSQSRGPFTEYMNCGGTPENRENRVRTFRAAFQLISTSIGFLLTSLSTLSWGDQEEKDSRMCGGSPEFSSCLKAVTRMDADCTTSLSVKTSPPLQK